MANSITFSNVVIFGTKHDKYLKKFVKISPLLLMFGRKISLRLECNTLYFLLNNGLCPGFQCKIFFAVHVIQFLKMFNSGIQAPYTDDLICNNFFNIMVEFLLEIKWKWIKSPFLLIHVKSKKEFFKSTTCVRLRNKVWRHLKWVF